jgi:O-antigen/teichoic acid export membrane protein
LKKLPKNILSIGLSEGFSRLLGFITTIYLARVLGVDGFGMINIGLTVFAYALLFGSQWLNLFGTREIAAGGDHDFVKSFFTLRLFLSFAIAMLIVLFSIFIIQDRQVAILISLFAISIIPNAINLDWYFQGKENLFPVSFVRVFVSFSYLVLIFVLLSYSSQYIFVPVAFFIANVIGVIFIWFYFLKEPEKVDLSLSVSGGFGILKKAFSLSSASVLAQINVNVPILVISLLMSTKDVGVFSAASKLIFFLLIADRLFYSIFFPAVTRIFSQNPNQLSEVISFVSRITLVLILPVAVSCVFLANDLILLFYGTNYLAAADVLKILIWYFCITILNSIMGYALVAINKENIYTKVIVYSTPIYFLMITVLTIFMGINGVAVAVVLYELILLAIFKYHLTKSVEISIFNNILRIIPALAILAAVYIILHPINYMLSLSVGLPLYFIAAYLMSAISKYDLKMLKEKLLWN